ncbi:unnamed protein product [Cylindrotheca closterium]|uniref:Prolylcarboxypeptidase n=1 Tax=Cylindrotheca closterium TaxID=2856 RepID=A0AAD2PUQ1_9STRA|nr:unnamed protein product [Cylindrotheca closterium]
MLGGYGSIAPQSIDEEKSESHSLDPPQPPQGSGGTAPHHADREVQVERASRFLFMLTILAIVAFGAFTTGDFVGDKQGNLTISGTSSRHHRNVLLEGHYDKHEMFFENQLVDHLNPLNKGVYPQRFYKVSKYWKGPGHPILVILGGEDSLDLPMLYPYVRKGLAKEFHAYVLSPEHRFYGKSQPVDDPTNDDLVRYLSPDQALLDVITLIQTTRESLGCSLDKFSTDYCPVITFGASYPGFLSAMLRFRFPQVVDIAYASSAPLELYAQTVAADAYFDKVSEVAEAASTGCTAAVRDTLYAARDELLTQYTSVQEAAKATGFCTHNFPAYIQNITEFISETIIYLVPAVFADFNMAYYPPGPKTALERACHIFQNSNHAPLKKISKLYDLRGQVDYGLAKKSKCFDLSLELPSGPNARIRGADSSGTGGGFTGEIWEFQCCKDLIIRASASVKSMFLPQPFQYAWLSAHCHERFEGVPMEPFRMVSEWRFNDLSHASRILFTNGMKDGWSTSSILQNTNPNIAIFNFPNGAHHSDLGNSWPSSDDTDDIVQGHRDATITLRQWLDEIKAENSTTTTTTTTTSSSSLR